MDIGRPPVYDSKERYGIQGWLQEVYRAIVRRTALTTQTTSYTIQNNIFYVRADATSGAMTVTLPLATSSEGRQVLICKVDASANAVTVDGNGSETIQGSASISLASQWDKALLICNGNDGWERIV